MSNPDSHHSSKRDRKTITRTLLRVASLVWVLAAAVGLAVTVASAPAAAGACGAPSDTATNGGAAAVSIEEFPSC